jgi:ring-1,2-phenylacetyl-CoA epoxidase subunit PaaE
MATHFHSVKVKTIKRETADCVSLLFEIPEDLKKDFQYKEGQNITIKKSIDGNEIRRSYSICAAPHENRLQVAIKQVDGGLFSSYANTILQEGELLDIMTPTGNFNAHFSPEKNAQYLAIAAGSGITPVISIIKHTLRSQPDSSFTLIFGNRNKGSIIFFDELQDIKNQYLGRFNLINILSRERMDTDIHYGRITAEKLLELKSLVTYKDLSSVYICGPEEMIFSAKDFLETEGLDKSKIHFELFTTPGQANTKVMAKATDEIVNSGPVSQVEITLDGRTFEMEVPYHGMSILDAALKHGADLPYACKGGVCSTCKAKITEGEADMAVNYALETDEVAKGFILTCQSHPRTEKLKVNFDMK